MLCPIPFAKANLLRIKGTGKDVPRTLCKSHGILPLRVAASEHFINSESRKRQHSDWPFLRTLAEPRVCVCVLKGMSDGSRKESQSQRFPW